MDMIELIASWLMVFVYAWLGVAIILQIYYLARCVLIDLKHYSYKKTKTYKYLADKYNGLAKDNFWLIVKLLFIVLIYYIFY